MGTISLLTREGEVQIAKRIEDGDRRVLQVVLSSSVAIEEILSLGDKLRKHEIRVKDVVKDVDEEDPEFDQQWHIDRICKVIDKVRRLWAESEDGLQAGNPGCASGSATEQEAIDKIVVRLKGFVERIAQARREISACEDEVGALREGVPQDVAGDPLVVPAPAGVHQQLGLRPEEIEEIWQVIATARKKSRRSRKRPS